MTRILLLTLCSIVFFTMQAMGQISIKGVVADMDNNPIKNVEIVVVGNDSYIESDSSGNFNFQVPSEGTYEVMFQHPDYILSTFPVILSQDTLQSIYINLEKANHLEEFVIKRKTETQIRKEQPIRAIVIETKDHLDRATSLAELINKSSGVRIRQSGGVGNTIDISINGFQGNSIQYFLDGIPIDYLGGGLAINNIPTNLLERIEVYKGVIPVSLGADALGGAVNLVTKNNFKSYINATYEVGSFNSHSVNTNLFHVFSNKKFYLGGNFVYNYSDNNYYVDVMMTDTITANPIPVRTRLFHNRYQQIFGEVYFGIKKTNWADDWNLKFSYFDIDRASQHPALMTIPYGKLMMYNAGWTLSTRYKKTWLNNKLSLDQFLTVSNNDRNRVDTVAGTYDWLGNFYPRQNGLGESPRPSNSEINFKHFVSRSNLIFQFNSRHKVELNYVFQTNNRIGSDPLGLKFVGTDIDVLSKEATYRKSVLGLSVENKWGKNNNWTNQFQVKHFHFYSKGVNGFLAVNSNLDDYETISSGHWGIGDALKYQINNKSMIRASVEYTYRLPSQLEIFGDNDTRAPNFELKPEKSMNVNLAYQFKHERYFIEVSAFYRNTSGMIMLIPIQPPFAQYTNLDSVRGYGIDIDCHQRLLNNFWLNANVSWQENRMTNISNSLYEWMNGTRLRNTPYFFGNIGLNYQKNEIFTESDILKVYTHYNYIREFYLNHIPKDKEPNGFLNIFGKSGVPITNLIPDQHLINVGATYGINKQGWSIGMEVKNVLNENLYDYYKIQRAGRSFHIKLNYILNY